MKYRLFKYFIFIAFLTAYSLLIPENAEANSKDYVILNGVLIKYMGSGGDIIIPDSVTTIGQSAFSNCETITSVIIPDSVTSIEASAFLNCTNLSKAVFPDSIEIIDGGAFYNTNLSEISIPETTVIGRSAFMNTPWFYNEKAKNPIVVLNGVLMDGSSCKGKVVIPDTVNIIGERAFFENNDITEVIIPDTVTDIGAGAFEDCYNLKKVVLPDSIVNIEGNAFTASGITSIAIPASVTKIDIEAFIFCSDLKEVYLPDSITHIEMGAFSYCRNLEKINIPKSVKKIDRYAFIYCENLREIIFTDDFNATLELDTFSDTAWLKEKRKQNPLVIGGKVVLDGKECTGDVIIPDGVMSIADNAFSYSKITSVYIPDSVISIGDSAFSNCEQLAIVRMGSSVSYLGPDSFYKCDLSEVELPRSLTSIEYGAFSSCTNLKEILIPDSIEFFGFNAFYQTPWLEQKQKENPLVIVNNILIDGSTCKGYVKVPEGVTAISDNAFFDNKTMTGIYIPSSVTSIGDRAFCINKSLVSVHMEDSVTHLGKEAFSGCIKLANVKLSNSLKAINRNTFENCSNLKGITLPSSLRSIEYVAFYNCPKLSRITIPDTVTYISPGAFTNCSDNLTFYGIRNSLSQSYIEYYGFKFIPLAPSKYITQKQAGSVTKLKLNSGSSCTWESNNPLIATVDRNGLVTTLKKGTVFITGTLYGKTYTFKVIVK